MKFISATLLAFLFTALSLICKAQEKYEYGQVSYAANLTVIKYVIATSIGSEFKVVDNGTLADGYITNNALPVNKVLNELAEKGWEVYSTQTTGYNNTTTFYYFIRKKKV